MFFVKLRNFIDSVFAVIRIPAAAAAVLLLPALWKTFKHYGMIFDKLNHYNLLYFAGGVVGMAAIRIGLRIHRGVAETFEHELTHILFALLTFHPVQSMSVNDYFSRQRKLADSVGSVFLSAGIGGDDAVYRGVRTGDGNAARLDAYRAGIGVRL